MKEYLSILGFEVRDRVTGFYGIATTVGFDLYGCVQVIVSPSGIDEKTGELKKGCWFDFKRLVIDGTAPVMTAPLFESVPGGYEKPLQ